MATKGYLKPMTLGAESDRLSILLLLFGGVGDAVLSSSMIGMIKRDLPGSYLAVLAWDNGGERVLQRFSQIDQLILYPFAATGSALRRLRRARSLRRYHFDIAVSYYSDYEYRVGVLGWLAGIRRRIGPYTPYHSFTLTDAIRMEPGRHILERNLDLLRPIGVREPLIKPWLPLTHDEMAQAARFIRENVPAGRRTIGISPGCGVLRKGWIYRRWGNSRYAELGKALTRTSRAFLLFFGSAEEKDDVDWIIRQAEVRDADCVNLAGRLDLFEFAALARACDVFVCNDSGALNIAAGVNARVLAIFGATDPAQAGPFSENSQALYVKQSCSPCLDVYRYHSTGCPPQYCMQAISPARVLQTIDSMLNLPRQANTSAGEQPI